MNIAWIGLGKLGLPMAARLAAAGHAVVGYDSNRARKTEIEHRSIFLAESVLDAVASSHVIFSSLPDDSVLWKVFHEDRLIEQLASGAMLIETSTVSPGASARLAALCDSHSVRYLRCPLSGGPTLAESGTLTALVSGPREAFDEAVPLLAKFSKAQTYLGPSEEARFAKLALNLMVATTAQMMAESLALARAGHIGWLDMLKLLDNSAVSSPVVKYKVPPLAERDFSATFSCSQMLKDLDLVVGAAAESGISAPLAALVRDGFATMVAEGYGDQDFIAAVKFVEFASGLGEP